MKKTFRSILAGALALLTVSCYDDSALRSAISDLESRVTDLENSLNTEVSTLNSKIDGLEAAYKLADQGLDTRIQALEAAKAANDTAHTAFTSRLDGIDQLHGGMSLATISEVENLVK